jgi:long-subunit acyl-CoA synthetase (AMP-forming)
MSRVLDAIGRRAAESPGAPALTDGRTTWGWAALEREIAAAADWLAGRLDGRPPEAPVALALDNGPAWVVLDLALARLGRASLPLPPFFTPEQVRHALADAGATLLVTPGTEAAVAGTAVAAQPLDLPRRTLHPGTAKITYTSGSTGAPKGVCLSQAQLEAVALSLVTAIGVEFAGRHLAVLPLGVLLENVAGLYPTLLAGGCYDVRPLGELGFGGKGAPDLTRLVAAAAASQATSLILVPELLRGVMAVLAQSGARLPALKLVAVGGAKVAPQLIAAARALGLPAYEGYGLSECGSVVALNTPHADRPGRVGRPLPHVELTLAADGEIVVGPEPFLGYVGGPPQTGPYRTGDLGAVDADGFVGITGRRSNTIITAYGRNVAPEWVESELLAEPEIAQAAVFGEAAAQLCALLAPARGDLGPEAIDRVVARVNARLPDYARVARWRGVAPFDPDRGEVTANGRPRRQALHAAHRDFIDQPL